MRSVLEPQNPSKVTVGRFFAPEGLRLGRPQAWWFSGLLYFFNFGGGNIPSGVGKFLGKGKQSILMMGALPPPSVSSVDRCLCPGPNLIAKIMGLVKELSLSNCLNFEHLCSFSRDKHLSYCGDFWVSMFSFNGRTKATWEILPSPKLSKQNMLNITKMNISWGPFHAISPYFARVKVRKFWWLQWDRETKFFKKYEPRWEDQN